MKTINLDKMSIHRSERVLEVISMFATRDNGFTANLRVIHVDGKPRFDSYHTMSNYGMEQLQKILDAVC